MCKMLINNYFFVIARHEAILSARLTAVLTAVFADV
jgi:hypothetical protein